MISRVPEEKVNEVYDLELSKGAIVYRFNAEKLNEGLDEYDVLFVDSMVHPMATTNMWNVCERFYSFIRIYGDSIDERLLNANR